MNPLHAVPVKTADAPKVETIFPKKERRGKGRLANAKSKRNPKPERSRLQKWRLRLGILTPVSLVLGLSFLISAFSMSFAGPMKGFVFLLSVGLFSFLFSIIALFALLIIHGKIQDMKIKALNKEIEMALKKGDYAKAEELLEKQQTIVRRKRGLIAFVVLLVIVPIILSI